MDWKNVWKLKSGESKLKLKININTTQQNMFIRPVFLNVLELGIKYFNLLPDYVLIWSYHSETISKNNKFSMSLGKQCDEA